MVSVTTTPTVTPSRSRSPTRNARRAAVGIDGKQAPIRRRRRWSRRRRRRPAPGRCAFSVISVRPLRASTRTASASMSLRRSASRSSGSVGAATMRPSHLDSTLLVTTTTSSSRSHGAAAAIAAARSSPGRNSGSPATGRISTAAAVPCSTLVRRGHRLPRSRPRVPVRRAPSRRSPPDRSSAAVRRAPRRRRSSASSPSCDQPAVEDADADRAP